MKRLFALLAVVAILLAGAAYAADEGDNGDVPVTVIVDDSNGNTTDDEVAAPPEDDSAAGPTEPREERRKRKTDFGLTVGMLNLTDSHAGDVFGDNAIRIGLRPLPTDVPEYWRTAFDINYYALSKSGDKARLLPIGVGVLRGFGKKEKTQTYVQVNVGPFYGNVNAPSVGVHKTGWGLNANATVGVIFNQKFCIEGRYDHMSKFGGFDFSAFSISAAIKVFSAKL